MRKIWIIALVGVILGGAALFEIWLSISYPLVEYRPSELPNLEGLRREYIYFRLGEKVGTYSYWVETSEERAGCLVYSSGSRTSVEANGTDIELVTLYSFDEFLSPVEYRLNATLGGERQYIEDFFTAGEVVASSRVENTSIEVTKDLPEYPILLDSYMPGHWELLFKVFAPVRGKRFRINAFIPQMMDFTRLEIVTDKKPETLLLDDTTCECTVVRVPDLNLVFYTFGGDLVQMEDTGKEIKISDTRVS
jgi:hypothetical protein